MTVRPLLRPVTAADEDFLFRLYASVRAPEVAQWGWGEAQREAFLRMQYAAQRAGYRAHYPNDAREIMAFEERAIGSALLHRGERELRLVDLALLPEHRGRGWGGLFLAEWTAEAHRTGRPFVLQVMKTNPARRLYERAGFRAGADDGVYLTMQNLPGTTTAGGG